MNITMKYDLNYSSWLTIRFKNPQYTTVDLILPETYNLFTALVVLK